MWDLIVSVPDHCLSFYFTSVPGHCLFIYFKENLLSLVYYIGTIKYYCMDTFT